MVKYTVSWLEPALPDLEDAYDFLMKRDETAAPSLFVTIWEQVEQLGNFPALGRIGRVKGTRELVMAGVPYFVVYQLKEGTIFVLAVIYGARSWPIDF